jgi:hypothetical protein
MLSALRSLEINKMITSFLTTVDRFLLLLPLPVSTRDNKRFSSPYAYTQREDESVQRTDKELEYGFVCLRIVKVSAGCVHHSFGHGKVLNS